MLVFATLYIINIPIRIAFFYSALSELAIITSRLYVVHNNPFCFIFPVISGGCLPFLDLQIYDFPGMYTWVFSEFGKSGFYQIYNFVVETILPVFTERVCEKKEENHEAKNTKFTRMMVVFIALSLSLLLMMAAHSFECFIYFQIDSNLNKIVTDMLVRSKVRIFLISSLKKQQ